jgi:TPR repeat protein
MWMDDYSFGHHGRVASDDGGGLDAEWDDIDHVTRLAEDGDVFAMNRLAILLAPSHPQQAIDWDRRAAEAGYLPSMYNLGVRLQKDHLEEAKQWWTRAAEAGHLSSMCALGRAWHGL